jgi:hypothetical protein
MVPTQNIFAKPENGLIPENERATLHWHSIFMKAARSTFPRDVPASSCGVKQSGLRKSKAVFKRNHDKHRRQRLQDPQTFYYSSNLLAVLAAAEIAHSYFYLFKQGTHTTAFYWRFNSSRNFSGLIWSYYQSPIMNLPALHGSILFYVRPM